MNIKNPLKIEVKETMQSSQELKMPMFIFVLFLSAQCFELKENCWNLSWKCFDHDYDATENRVDKLRIHLAQMASL